MAARLWRKLAGLRVPGRGLRERAGAARRRRLALPLEGQGLGQGWGQVTARGGEITESVLRGGVRVGRGPAGAGRWQEVCFSRQWLGMGALNKPQKSLEPDPLESAR